jgi:uncharacterized surface protein with fasciclin (FAS1) repeats
MRRALHAVLAIMAIGWTSLAARAEDCATGPVDLKTAAAQTGLLTRMAEIKTLAGLDGASAHGQKLTIFAPSDAAFDALPEPFKVAILKPENRMLLVDLLLHHAVIGEYPTERLRKARATHYGVDAADGTHIEFTLRQHRASLDIHGARVVKGDIVATNGILHVIDRVLIPKAVQAAIDAQVLQQTAAVEE